MTKIENHGTREIITGTVRAAGYAEDVSTATKLPAMTPAVAGELIGNGWAAFRFAPVPGLFLTSAGHKLGCLLLS